MHAWAACRDSVVFDWKPYYWRHLNFRNRLGIAGGVDKDASQIEAWWKFGPGFVEVGTVTPLPQAPNSGKIFDRDTTKLALWNRMGFPGQGAWEVRENLRDLRTIKQTPIFVNIGKNRSTSLNDAANDYAKCIHILAGDADVFVINISSPNTAGLRDLFQPDYFKSFIEKILAARNVECPTTPLLLKLSPDIEFTLLAQVVEQSYALGIDGWVTTNTTLAREDNSKFPTEGGVSGAPLAELSKQTLRNLISILGSRKADRLVVSVGGVMTPQDVVDRINLGADLVQVYSALVFEGPLFFEHVARHLALCETV